MPKCQEHRAYWEASKREVLRWLGENTKASAKDPYVKVKQIAEGAFRASPHLQYIYNDGHPGVALPKSIFKEKYVPAMLEELESEGLVESRAKTPKAVTITEAGREALKAPLTEAVTLQLYAVSEKIAAAR